MMKKFTILKNLTLYAFLTVAIIGLVQSSCKPDETEPTQYNHKLIFNSNIGDATAKVYEDGLKETLTLSANGTGEIQITNEEKTYLLDSVTVEKTGFIKWTEENPVVQTEKTFNITLIEEEELTEFELLTEYVKDNNLDFSNILYDWVTAATSLTLNVDNSVQGYTVFDFRSATVYAAGHIAGAVNVTFGNMLTEAANTTGPILCVCYTGQTSARATGLLKLSGYEAKSLKWGMAGWNPDFHAQWDANAEDDDSPNWVDTDDDWTTQTTFDVPVLSTGNYTGADILADRIEIVIAMASWAVSKTDVLGNPTDYFVNHKWSADSWNYYGHVAGAYRIDTAEGLGIDGIKYFDSSNTVVTCCYTGQTSAITTAWLQVMGVDNARSMLFGANAIVNTALIGHSEGKAWGGANSGTADYDYVIE